MNISRRRIFIVAGFLVLFFGIAYLIRLCVLATPQQALEAARIDNWARVRQIGCLRPSSLREARDPADGTTPLLLAAQHANIEMVRFLIGKGIDINVWDGFGRIPLHAAAISGSLELVKYLVENGADMSKMDGDGRAALHLAAAEGHDQIVLYLLTKGADPNQVWMEMAKSPRYDTPLICAVENKHLATARILLNNGADPNGPNNYGNRPLGIAVYLSDYYMVKNLLENGADPGDEALIQLAESQANKMTKLLRECQAKGK